MDAVAACAMKKLTQLQIASLVGRKVWIGDDKTPRYIHNIVFGTTDKNYSGQPHGYVVFAHGDIVKFKRPST